MQAIEFETHLQNGFIPLPTFYQNWQQGKKVKVILLSNDSAIKSEPATPNLNRHAGKIDLTQDALEFQNAMRDEWT